ncbi:hypothetical protein PCE1_002986 [Barthelona sp. PCE]
MIFEEGTLVFEGPQGQSITIEEPNSFLISGNVLYYPLKKFIVVVNPLNGLEQVFILAPSLQDATILHVDICFVLLSCTDRCVRRISVSPDGQQSETLLTMDKEGEKVVACAWQGLCIVMNGDSFFLNGSRFYSKDNDDVLDHVVFHRTLPFFVLSFSQYALFFKFSSNELLTLRFDKGLGFLEFNPVKPSFLTTVHNEGQFEPVYGEFSFNNENPGVRALCISDSFNYTPNMNWIDESRFITSRINSEKIEVYKLVSQPDRFDIDPQNELIEALSDVACNPSKMIGDQICVFDKQAKKFFVHKLGSLSMELVMV